MDPYKMIDETQLQLAQATVTEIAWERILLHLQVQVQTVPALAGAPLDFYLVNGRYECKAQFDVDKQENGVYFLSLNVTNLGNHKVLPAGSYKLMVCHEQQILTRAVIEPAYSVLLEERSRNFLYKNRNNVFTASFMVEEGGDDLPLLLVAMSSKRCGTAFPQNKPKNHGQWKTFRAYRKKNFRRFMRWLYARYSGQFANREKVVLFLSEQSNPMGSNLQAVYDKMVERGLDKEYTLLTSARMASSVSQSMGSWVQLIKKLAMADTIFLDDHAPVLDWLPLNSKTKVIQLWHAGAGFKSSGYSRWGHNGCPAPSSCHRQYKYGIAGSRHIAHFFSEVWGINTERVLPTGMPRMDEYLDPAYRERKTEELYAQFPLCKGKKRILFAPTYRGRGRASAQYPYELIDFDRLYQLCGDEYVVLFKMHPWVAEPVPIPEAYQDKFVDVNTYPNINDLFYITDLLITDYSSNIFEYSLMRKPMLFFAFDKIQYSFSRGFHRDYEESAPGKVCYTFDELLTALETKDFEYEKVEKYVEEHFDYIDSHACDRVIDWLLLEQMPQELREAIDERDARVRRWQRLDFTDMMPVEEELGEDDKVEETSQDEPPQSNDAQESEN